MKTATQTSLPSTLPVAPATPVPASTAASPVAVHPGFPTPSTPQAFLPQFIPMMPPFYNPFAMASPLQATTVTPEEPRGIKRTADLRSSSPVYNIEDDQRMTIEEFCAHYRLGDKAVKGLTELQFVPGDKLSVVSDQEYISAGFTSLSWRRIVHANKDYISSLPR